jgi:hypothetical protein
MNTSQNASMDGNMDMAMDVSSLKAEETERAGLQLTAHEDHVPANTPISHDHKANPKSFVRRWCTRNIRWEQNRSLCRRI